MPALMYEGGSVGGLVARWVVPSIPTLQEVGTTDATGHCYWGCGIVPSVASLSAVMHEGGTVDWVGRVRWVVPSIPTLQEVGTTDATGAQ